MKVSFRDGATESSEGEGTASGINLAGNKARGLDKDKELVGGSNRFSIGSGWGGGVGNEVNEGAWHCDILIYVITGARNGGMGVEM